MVDRAAAPCAYCDVSSATEEDHVFARQLFPPDNRWRGNLPKVPSCSSCNRGKQRLEDYVGVLFQLSADTEASRRVLGQRVRRTLRKNRRLQRQLQSSFRTGWVAGAGGVLRRRAGFKLTDEDISTIVEWFRLVVRGLYHVETKAPLGSSRVVRVFHRSTPGVVENFYPIVDADSQERRVADGEVFYRFSVASDERGLSGWVIWIRAIEVLALTLASGSAEDREMRCFDWGLPSK